MYSYAHLRKLSMRSAPLMPSRDLHLIADSVRVDERRASSRSRRYVRLIGRPVGAGSSRPCRKRGLSPSEKYEIYVSVLTGQATDREAAERYGVDRTVVTACRWPSRVRWTRSRRGCRAGDSWQPPGGCYRRRCDDRDRSFYALYAWRPHDGGRRRAPSLGCWTRGGGGTLPTSGAGAGERGTMSSTRAGAGHHTLTLSRA